MKYRTTKEILETPIEQQIEEVFVQLFGEVLGKELFVDYKTNPLYAEKYQEQVRLTKEHQERMRELDSHIRPTPIQYYVYLFLGMALFIALLYFILRK